MTMLSENGEREWLLRIVSENGQRSWLIVVYNGKPMLPVGAYCGYTAGGEQLSVDGCWGSKKNRISRVVDGEELFCNQQCPWVCQ